jgi:uncharacterized protein with HEPN domain
MSRDVHVYLLDISSGASGSHATWRDWRLDEERWSKDERTQDAVLRNLEVIGEAVKRLPPDLRQRAPEIPWQDIAGLRDVLIHEYEGVDLAIIWDVTVNEVPVLRQAVSELLK